MAETDSNYINVTLKTDHTADRGLVNIDLRIPNRLTVRQLLTQLIDAMAAQAVTLTPDDRNMIRVINKALVLSDDDVLADFPVTNGDVIEVL
ncbi:EsaB/YukD family protein [Furfurilactobacillus sp. WILCCON 0119]